MTARSTSATSTPRKENTESVTLNLQLARLARDMLNELDLGDADVILDGISQDAPGSIPEIIVDDQVRK
jgi:hypothetical protein